MAKARDYSKAHVAETLTVAAAEPSAAVPNLFVPNRRGPQYTGRSVVVFREKASDSGLRQIASATGLKMVANTSDYKAAAVDLAEVASADAVYFHHLDVCVYEGDPRATPPAALAGQQ